MPRREAEIAGVENQLVGAGDEVGDVVETVVAARRLEDETVRTRATGQGVVAAQPAQDIVAVAAIDDVGSAVAGDGVAKRIAGGIDSIVAVKDQGFDIGRQGIGYRRIDDVGAFVDVLDDLVVDVVDIIGVVAGAAFHGVGALTAVQQVVARIADQGVGLAIADRLDVGRTAQGNVLDIARDDEIDRRQDGIGAGIVAFGDLVASIVDHIGVVARTANHGVRAGAAIEQIIAGAAIEGVIAALTIHIVAAGRAGERIGGGVADHLEQRAGRKRHKISVLQRMAARIREAFLAVEQDEVFAVGRDLQA